MRDRLASFLTSTRRFDVGRPMTSQMLSTIEDTHKSHLLSTIPSRLVHRVQALHPVHVLLVAMLQPARLALAG